MQKPPDTISLKPNTGNHLLWHRIPFVISRFFKDPAKRSDQEILIKNLIKGDCTRFDTTTIEQKKKVLSIIFTDSEITTLDQRRALYIILANSQKIDENMKVLADLSTNGNDPLALGIVNTLTLVRTAVSKVQINAPLNVFGVRTNTETLAIKIAIDTPNPKVGEKALEFLHLNFNKSTTYNALAQIVLKAKLESIKADARNKFDNLLFGLSPNEKVRVTALLN